MFQGFDSGGYYCLCYKFNRWIPFRKYWYSHENKLLWLTFAIVNFIEIFNFKIVVLQYTDSLMLNCQANGWKLQAETLKHHWPVQWQPHDSTNWWPHTLDIIPKAQEGKDVECLVCASAAFPEQVPTFSLWAFPLYLNYSGKTGLQAGLTSGLHLRDGYVNSFKVFSLKF